MSIFGFGKKKTIQKQLIKANNAETEENEQEKPIVVEVPEDMLKNMITVRDKHGKSINQLLTITFRLGDLQDESNTLRKQIKSLEESYNAKIKLAYRKLKLHAKGDYRWQYDNKSSFIGIKIPKPKVKNPDTK